MRIVVDTNVLISGLFFGGYPRKILEYIYEGVFSSCANDEIIEEYREVLLRFKEKSFDDALLSRFFDSLIITKEKSNIKICRDPHDNKFLSAAIDSNAIYVVSGDEDLLVLKKIKDIEIITAKELCDRIKVIDEFIYKI